MTFEEYAQWCLTKWKLPPEAPLEQHLGNVALGLAGEWAEVEEALTAYGPHPQTLADLEGAMERRHKVALELGDVLFYFAIAATLFDKFYKHNRNDARQRYFAASDVVRSVSTSERNIRKAVGRVCDGVKKALYHDRPFATDEKLRYQVERDLQTAFDELHAYAGYVVPGGLHTIALENQRKLNLRYAGKCTAEESRAKKDEQPAEPRAYIVMTQPGTAVLTLADDAAHAARRVASLGFIPAKDVSVREVPDDWRAVHPSWLDVQLDAGAADAVLARRTWDTPRSR